MALIEIQNYGFSYAGCEQNVLSGISLDIDAGDFVLVCGRSGSGKTTLLRSLKREIAPVGISGGEIIINGKKKFTLRESAETVGFVMQDPDNQLVMDSVWLELAFGLENLAVPPEEIGRRIGEIAAFFGIEKWFGKNVFELSGGQKQILCLASVIAMQAEIIILDEPTAQLDPIAAEEFLHVLKKVGKELGKTILISEHRLEELLSDTDKVLYLEKGNVRYYGTNREFPMFLAENGEEGRIYAEALPAPTRLSLQYPISKNHPLNVREGRKWLAAGMTQEDTSGQKANTENAKIPRFYCTYSPPAETGNVLHPAPVISLKDVWFRYGKDEAFVLKGLETKIDEGTLHAYVGSNGSGKSTMLKVISGILKPQRGKVVIAPGKRVGMLFQDPKSLFVSDTLRAELSEHLNTGQQNAKERKAGETKTERIATPEATRDMAEKLGLSDLLDRHPYDLSAGEMQKAALAKVLLLRPDILLLDEPTKGLDAFSKREIAEILMRLKEEGVTIAMVTHDLEFTAQYADRCSMIFGSAVIATDSGRAFFENNMFYTTSVSRMSRGILDGCILASDIGCREDA
ncbi:MAG: ATP-binding cassette domain-containing protein [Clostridiales Family XIII bacterium]|jgi:energy-coupling factor transport system ATP-binding protein|nr:ATP-binding cassette domain-containing protein [Clostridiales Family XIII bacterium]